MRSRSRRWGPSRSRRAPLPTGCAMRWSGRITSGRATRASAVRGGTEVSEAFRVDSSQLFRHSASVRAVCDQLTAIKGASSAISQDDSAYGLLCGWISAVLERRHGGQDQLYGYVEENLQLLAE